MLHLGHAYQKSITHAENVNIVMPLYNLLEYSYNYSVTSGSLQNYFRDEMNVYTNVNNDNSKAASTSFEYKTKIMGRTPINNNTLEQKLFH